MPIHPDAFQLLSEQELQAYGMAQDPDKAIIERLVQFHASCSGIPNGDGEDRPSLPRLAFGLVSRLSRNSAVVLDRDDGPMIEDIPGPTKPVRDVFKSLLDDPGIAVAVVLHKFEAKVHAESLKFYRKRLASGGKNPATLTADVVQEFEHIYNTTRERSDGRFSDLPFLAALEADTAPNTPRPDRAHPFVPMDEDTLNKLVTFVGEKTRRGHVEKTDVDTVAKLLSLLPLALTESGLLVFERAEKEVRDALNAPLRQVPVQHSVMGTFGTQRLGRSFFDAYDGKPGGDMPIVVEALPETNLALKPAGVETLTYKQVGKYL